MIDNLWKQKILAGLTMFMLSCICWAQNWEIFYISLPGCRECEETLEQIQGVLVDKTAESGFDLNLHELNVLNKNDFSFLLELAERTGLSYSGTPQLIIQLIKNETEQITAKSFYGNNLEITILENWFDQVSSNLSLQIQPAIPKQTTTINSSRGIESILQPLAVFTAGLVDGINPCAISTLLFMLSVLASSQRKKTQIIVLGLGFTGGVYFAYLGIGLGLLQTAAALGLPEIVARVFELLAASLMLILAVLSIRDALLVSSGKPKSTRLRLPDTFQRYAHRLIRHKRALWFGLGGAWLLGLLLSVIEFACTGQVYLPMLIYMNRVNPIRFLPLLLLYNFAFIIPLLVVFGFVLAGVSHHGLTRFARKHAALSKYLLSGLFLVIAGLLVLGT